MNLTVTEEMRQCINALAAGTKVSKLTFNYIVKRKGTNPTTINQAFRRLESEGLIERCKEHLPSSRGGLEILQYVVVHKESVKPKGWPFGVVRSGPFVELFMKPFPVRDEHAYYRSSMK